MDRLIYLNGHLYPPERALLPVTEEGLLYGLGLFETIRVEKGRALFLEEHLKRILTSTQRIDISPPGIEEMREAVEMVIKKNQLELGRLRLNLTSHHLFIIPYCGLPYCQKDYEEGFKAIILKQRRLSSSLIASMKSFNFLENILGRRRAVEEGAHEGLFINERGYLTEGSVSNLFLFQDHRWMTPATGQGLLPGITRELMLKIFKNRDISFKEREDLRVEDLYHGEEAFLTNSLLEVMPLISCDGHLIGDGRPGPLTREISLYYTTMKEGYGHDSSHR